MATTAIAELRVYPQRMEGYNFRYLYPFVVDIAPVDGAQSYELIAADANGERYRLQSATSEISLQPVWERLADGFVRYNIVARRGDGSSVNDGRVYSFFKAGRFEPSLTVAPKWPLAVASDMHFAFISRLRCAANFDPDLSPIIWHCVMRAESRSLYEKAYPGLHYPFYLWSLMRYSRARPELSGPIGELLQQVAAKSMEFVTPAHYKWPRFPYSTISQGKMGGDQEQGDSIQPLKGAQLAAALFDYGTACGHQPSVAFAGHVGEVLAERQRPDGSLPFRVDANTDEVEAGESSGLIFALELWDRLEKTTPGKYRNAMDKALKWLLNGPARTMKWVGNYEDIETWATHADSVNFNNYDAIRMALYLLDHRDEDPGYEQLAKRIDRWIEEGFVFYKPEFPVACLRFVTPAVMEQSVHYYPIDFHMGELRRAANRVISDHRRPRVFAESRGLRQCAYPLSDGRGRTANICAGSRGRIRLQRFDLVRLCRRGLDRVDGSARSRGNRGCGTSGSRPIRENRRTGRIMEAKIITGRNLPYGRSQPGFAASSGRKHAAQSGIGALRRKEAGFLLRHDGRQLRLHLAEAG